MTPFQCKSLLQDVFNLTQMETELVIRHFYYTKGLQFTEANIEEGDFSRTFKIFLFGKELRSTDDFTDQELMLFELDSNIDELKCAIKKVESHRNLIEKEVENLIKDDKELAKAKMRT
jgi:hypothetical protein